MFRIEHVQKVLRWITFWVIIAIGIVPALVFAIVYLTWAVAVVLLRKN